VDLIQMAVRNSVAVTVCVLLVMIFGVVAIFSIPVQMTPDISATKITVLTDWPGATPQDIEREIVMEQEKYLRSIPSLDRMVASASTGSASIELEFRTGSDLNEILVRVNNALSQVPTYPENVDQPRISTSSASDQPIAWFSVRPRSEAPPDLDVMAQRDFIDDFIKTEIERTPGVSQVEIYGGAERQVRLYVDPAKLAERQISISELRDALRLRNRDTSGGDFDEGKRRYLIRTMGRFTSVDDLMGTVIARRNDTPVHFRDVGTVEISRQELRVEGRHNGSPMIAFNVRQESGTNIMEVMSNVRGTVARLNDTLMKDRGLNITQVSDDTTYIRDSIWMVASNLMLGGILAFIVLFLFLRSFKTTMIGAMAIPVCTIASFLGLVLFGRTINVISLAGVAFAIGMTVDASIVVLENIDRHRSMGKSALEAALDGVKEVWGAILASALTTIFVFFPIILIQEEAGQLFADIAIAISSAITASLFLATLVIPVAAARYMGSSSRTSGEIRTARGYRRLLDSSFGLAPMGSKFKDGIMWVLAHILRSVPLRLALVFTMAGLSILIAWRLAPQTEYLPDGNRNVMLAIVVPPPGYNIDEMTRIANSVEAVFLPHVGADRAADERGGVEIPPIQEFFFIATTQQMFAVVIPKEGRDFVKLQTLLTDHLNSYPGLIAFSFRFPIFAGDISGSRGIEYNITGEEFESLYAVLGPAFGEIMDVIGSMPRPDPPVASLGQPVLEIRPDWERAAELGVDAAELGYFIWAFTDGAYVDEFFLPDDKIDMYLYSTQGTVERTQDLEGLLFASANGTTVPLGSMASVVQVPSLETIRRMDQRRAITLTVTPPVEMPLERAVGLLENDVTKVLIERGVVPDGVSLDIAGASDKLAATREALGGNFLLAIIISYLLMVALFAHWGYPAIIMTSLPLGIVGGVVGLFLLNHSGDLTFGLVPNTLQPLDVLTMLGFVILVGTVVNNPILIVEQALLNIRDHGMDWYNAVVESTRTRIRPIMMSTLTTVFGIAPLVFIPGAGTELYRGLGAIILFGLFFSAIFTLTFMPAVLSLFLQLGEWNKKRRATAMESRASRRGLQKLS
jgi:multidrug efflux pump subunit AcrB